MDREYVYLKDLIKEISKDKHGVPMILGKNSKGNIVTKELDNILIGGHTSTGKSVFLNGVICTLIKDFSPEELELVLIDSKRAQFHIYEGIKYLRKPVSYRVEESVNVLEKCVLEINRRKKEKVKKPYIVILIDEFADLVIQDTKSEELICDIASNGKDVGVYILLSSSMVSERVFTEKIKGVIPKRLIGAVASKKNSLWVLGEEGGVELEGNGDMIFKDMKTKEKIRVQTPFVSTEEILAMKKE